MPNEHAVESAQLERSLIEVAVESWRFSRLFARLVSKLDAGESSRYVNQLRYFQKKLEEWLSDRCRPHSNAWPLRAITTEPGRFRPVEQRGAYADASAQAY